MLRIVAGVHTCAPPRDKFGPIFATIVPECQTFRRFKVPGCSYLSSTFRVPGSKCASPILSFDGCVEEWQLDPSLRSGQALNVELGTWNDLVLLMPENIDAAVAVRSRRAFLA